MTVTEENEPLMRSLLLLFLFLFLWSITTLTHHTMCSSPGGKRYQSWTGWISPVAFLVTVPLHSFLTEMSVIYGVLCVTDNALNNRMQKCPFQTDNENILFLFLTCCLCLSSTVARHGEPKVIFC